MSIKGRHAWDGVAAWQEKETNARNTGVWMPTPLRGRFMPSKGKQKRDTNPELKAPGVDGITGATVHLMIVPGPQGLWQVCRIELRTPVARGFRTKEQARGWIGRAVRAGVLPEGVVEVEPPSGDE